MASHSHQRKDPHPEIEAIEAELSEIWPGYKRTTRAVNVPEPGGKTRAVLMSSLKGQPFTRGGMPLPPFTLSHVRRIKYLLKRYDLLQSGRDWGVVIISDPKNPSKCYVHVRTEQPQRDEDIPPPVIGTTKALPVNGRPSAAHIAMQHGYALSRVQAALDEIPDMMGDDVSQWVIERLSMPVLASVTNVPIEVVEDAMNHRPSGHTDLRGWVTSWAQGQTQEQP